MANVISGCPGKVILGSGVASNSVDLTIAAMGISFAVAGAIKINDGTGTTVVIPVDALAAGVQHSLVITRLWSTGTDATGIVLYLP